MSTSEVSSINTSVDTLATSTAIKSNPLKRKHSEMGLLNSVENNEAEPPTKKQKQDGKNEDESTGATSYAPTKRQERREERSGFSQKERNAHKRKQKKERKKLENSKKFESMTEEEKTAHVNAKWEKRRLKQQQKEMYNKKVLEASKTGMKICIDLSFNKLYNKDMEYTNVLKQLCYCWNFNKLAKYSASVHLLNVDENWTKYFQQQGISGWKGINIHENKDILDAFPDIKDDKNKFIYLTPDSDQELNEDEFIKDKKNGCVYILGGIVDRTIVKDLTLNKAKELGIRHRKLPLDRLKDISGRKCLNINNVFNMLLKFQDDEQKWDDIMDKEVPNRNRKSSKPKKQRRKKNKDTEKNDDNPVDSGYVAQPTNQPTTSPTNSPTNSSTNYTINATLESSSSAPTHAATNQPTKSPTDYPTSAPSELPSSAPTDHPTRQPTNQTTHSPTNSPTNQPTNQSTSQPTNSPTNYPTKAPSELPSLAPTNQTSSPIIASVNATQNTTNDRQRQRHSDTRNGLAIAISLILFGIFVIGCIIACCHQHYLRKRKRDGFSLLDDDHPLFNRL